MKLIKAFLELFALLVGADTAALRRMPDHYFNKLKEAEAFCGTQLRRERAGFSGTLGNTEYIAIKISV